MPIRKADQARAKARKTQQHGETEEQYRERIRLRLEGDTKLRVTIDTHTRDFRDEFLIRGYVPSDQMPAVQIRRASLESAVGAFESAAFKFARMPKAAHSA